MLCARANNDHRITSAQTAATNQPRFQGDTDNIHQCWAETFSYDPWGNLLAIKQSTSSLYTGCTQESGFDFSAPGLIGTNNRINTTGYVYDAAGNLITSPGSGTVVFNAENQIVCAGGTTYFYDGDGKRVEKATGCAPSTLTPSTLYWYGTGSDALLETNSAGLAFNDYVYFDGKRVAKLTSLGQGGFNWFMNDALGSSRVVWSTAGMDISDFYPFGGERVIAAANGTNNRYKFTGKERDSESGLDNFGARFDSSALGRFMGPDQLGPGQHPTNPQTWNLYSYVLNNPLKLVDPTGEFTCDAKTVSDQQCDNFQAALDKAQEAADKLGETKGWDSKEYLAAQRAIDSYGDEGKDNGVVIAQGDTGGFGASTDLAGKDFPGEKVVVTFDQKSGGLDGGNIKDTAVLAGHEGEHVANDLNWLSHGQSDNKWIQLGLSPDLPHTRLESEQRAFSVGNSIAEGFGSSWIDYAHNNTTYHIPIPITPAGQDRMEIMIKSAYPNWNVSIFKSNTKSKR